MRRIRRSALALLALGAAALVITACGSSKSSGGGSAGGGSSGNAKGKPILIGAAVDFSALMAPTDDPALYGAEIEASKINSQGGVDGHQIKFAIANTQL